MFLKLQNIIRRDENDIWGSYLFAPVSKIRHNELPEVIKKYERWFNCFGGSQPDAYPELQLGQNTFIMHHSKWTYKSTEQNYINHQAVNSH